MITIVIPSRDEGQELLSCLSALSMLEAVGEVVVASHRESMETCLEARRRYPGVVWIDCPKASRGDQLNRGAAVARGDVLIFLHADSRLPDEAMLSVKRAFARPDVVAGAFTLAFDATHPVLRMLSALSHISWRTAFFGDQAMFCTRAAFESIGGFRDAPLFEDVDLALALAQRGKLARVGARVTTSARRFVSAGPGRQLLRNAALLALHYAGIPAHALARSYKA